MRCNPPTQELTMLTRGVFRDDQTGDHGVDHDGGRIPPSSWFEGGNGGVAQENSRAEGFYEGC